MPDDLADLADNIRAELARRRGERIITFESSSGVEVPIARGPVAGLLTLVTTGGRERYTVQWAGWRRPFSVLVTRWEGSERRSLAAEPDTGTLWRSTGDGTAFAPLFYARLWLARRRQRRDFPRARAVSS